MSGTQISLFNQDLFRVFQKLEDSQFSESGWIQWFCSLEDHHFFCEVDEDYIRDNFNLYGLKQKISHYK